MPEDYRPRYYTPAEVSVHCTPEDSWVSLLGGVYNLTSLLQEHTGVLVGPLQAAAGSDISHWFDTRTGDVKEHFNPDSNRRCPYCPQGRFVHVPPRDPRTDWDAGFVLEWWRDHARFRVGALMRRACLVRICNALTGDKACLEVPVEETLGEIRERYLRHNMHARAYAWTVLRLSGVAMCAGDFEELDMAESLEGNGLINELHEMELLGLVGDKAATVMLHLTWCDDLTAA